MYIYIILVVLSELLGFDMKLDLPKELIDHIHSFLFIRCKICDRKNYSSKCDWCESIVMCSACYKSNSRKDMEKCGDMCDNLICKRCLACATCRPCTLHPYRVGCEKFYVTVCSFCEYTSCKNMEFYDLIEGDEVFHLCPICEYINLTNYPKT